MDSYSKYLSETNHTHTVKNPSKIIGALLYNLMKAYSKISKSPKNKINLTI